MKTIFLVLILSISSQGFSQNQCEVKVASLISVLEKNYKELPSDGAKFLFVDSCKYLVGIGTSSTNSKTISTMSRIASVKARREVVNLINGVNISSQTIITTEEIITDKMVSYAEIFRSEIKENSAGFVQGMIELTKFKSADNSTFIYILYKVIN